jgi:hypothetical protein
MEKWKDIKDYEYLYQVSNHGNIRSLDRIVEYSNGKKALHKGRIKSQPTNCKTEYRIAVLSKNNKQRAFKISRLVAFAFIDNKNDLPVVNHIDGNKKNDHFSNLEWCTYSHNSLHAFDNGLSKKKSKYTGVGWDKNRNKYGAYVYRDNKNLFVGRFDTEELAAEAIARFKIENKY